MSDRNGPKAGGFLLAMSILAGAVVGTIEGQSSFGVIAGTAIGIVIALILWWADQSRGRR